jgi:hypothetical protein
MITFDYFTMHNTAWNLLEELKEKFARIHGVEFLQYMPQEDKLPFVVGYTFSTAAGRKGLKDEDNAEPVDSFINAAAELLHGFLIKGQGRVVKDRSETKVEPEELANLEFKDYDPWRMDKLMAEVRKMSRTMGGLDAGAGGKDCPVQ